MWGTQIESARRCVADRFTPTHVGNTKTPQRSEPATAVHPHACGEHEAGSGDPLMFTGSPPRMWGTPAKPGPLPRSCRFTPTHVGNTCRAAGRGPSSTVHPHACGEHPLDYIGRSLIGGSPPRMWGTRAVRRRRRGRFTPTHVGNTQSYTVTGTGTTVHPHACGEHPGSHPRSPQRHRFTPTHVGNTNRARASQFCRTVHPHACGEHCYLPARLLFEAGSPPRMWGTRPVC